MHKTTAWDEWEARYDKLTEREKRLTEREITLLLKFGRQRLGEPDIRTQAVLDAIEDSDRLERMLDQILTVKSWKALLSIK